MGRPLWLAAIHAINPTNGSRPLSGGGRANAPAFTNGASRAAFGPAIWSSADGIWWDAERGITYVGWQFSEWLCLLVAARPGITDFRVLCTRGGRRVLRHRRPRGGIADPGRGDRKPAGTAAVVCPDQPGSPVRPASALHALAQGDGRRAGAAGSGQRRAAGSARHRTDRFC